MVGHVFLGKYKTIRPLDEGGMSRIYLARQTNPDREVVVKVLKETQLAQSTIREHFRREIHITSRFQHPYAVAFLDADPKAAEGPVLVLEYLRGVDLNELLHREKRFTPERTGRLLTQLCSVLQAAHDAGVVHRDIKPGNLMIIHPGTPVEQLKLMDFGLAKMSSLLYISPDELFDYTLPPAAGTPEYIAPEQVRGNEMDGRGDLYSVGVVLYEILTGRRPFAAPTVDGLMRAHAESPPPTFAELGLADLVPPAVERLVRDCLAKHPDDRPASACGTAAVLRDRTGQAVPAAAAQRTGPDEPGRAGGGAGARPGHPGAVEDARKGRDDLAHADGRGRPLGAAQHRGADAGIDGDAQAQGIHPRPGRPGGGQRTRPDSRAAGRAGRREEG